MMPKLFLLLLAGLTALPALADAQSRLAAFVAGSQRLKAQFTQTVIDRGGRKVQDASGELFFSRPGKFRWVYRKPYSQLLVGDGKKLWIYDQDLDQVTVKKLDRALGDSPAALLAGDNDIERLFNLKEVAGKDGLEWIEATPKGKDSGFESVRMGFRDEDLAAMELKDNFGQTTLLRFTRVERNPSLSKHLFHFDPPKGADVIGDR